MRKRILLLGLASCLALAGLSGCGKDEEQKHATSWFCHEWNRYLPAKDVPIDSPEANRALDQLADIVRDKAGGRLDDRYGVKGRLAYLIRRDCKDTPRFSGVYPNLQTIIANQVDGELEARRGGASEETASPGGPPYEQVDPGPGYAPRPAPSGSAAGAAEPRPQPSAPAPEPEPEPSSPPVAEPEPAPTAPPHTPAQPQPSPPPQHSP